MKKVLFRLPGTLLAVSGLIIVGSYSSMEVAGGVFLMLWGNNIVNGD